MPDILVIGGGAAGMMAALAAAEAGASVTLLERNEKLGRKIYITGKGRCNLTNDCTLEEFLREVPGNPRFLYSALTAFGPQDMMALMENGGCPVKTERGRRVFPVSDHASDVTRCLEGLLRRRGVTIRLNARVRSLSAEEGRVTGAVLESGEKIAASRVILATGGRSYEGTGSTGDGYRMAEAAGHTIVPLRPGLAGLELREDWPKRLQGLSLKNVTLTLKQGKKTLYQEQGEMLFTHFGISGPLALTACSHLPEDVASARLTLNLKPALDRETLDNRLVREMTQQSRKRLRTALCALLPSSLAEEFPGICGLDGEKTCDQLTRQERSRLADTLQALPLTVTRPRPIEEAIITRGGVSVKETDPKTMESKRLPGLYFAGELLDTDAHTGGYNLQIAWSTGHLAGKSAAESVMKEDREVQ